MTILEKFNKQNPVNTAAARATDFYKITPEGLQPMDANSAEVMARFDEVFGICNVPAEFVLEIGGFESDDFSGEMAVAMKLECRLKPVAQLAQFVSGLVISSPETFAWDSDEIFGAAFEKKSGKIRAWLTEKIGETAPHLLKKYQGGALFDENESFDDIVPPFVGAEYIDAQIVFRGEGEPSPAQQLLNKAVSDLNLKKALAEVQLQSKDTDISIAATNTALDRKMFVAQNAAAYGIPAETVATLVDNFLSLENVAQILEKTRTSCESAGMKFVDVIQIVMGVRTYNEAIVKVDEVCGEFAKVMAFKNDFEEYGVETVDDARAEIAECGGYAKAKKIWNTALKIKQTYPSAKQMNFENILALVKERGADEAEALFAGKIEKSKKLKSVLAVALLAACLIAAAVFWREYSAVSELKIATTGGAPSAIEHVFADSFGGGYALSADGVFSVRIDKKRKAEFLKKLGENAKLYPTANADEFVAEIPESLGEIAITIDARAVSANGEALKTASAVFGKTVGRGRTNLVTTRNKITQCINALEAESISAALEGSSLVLKPIPPRATTLSVRIFTGDKNEAAKAANAVGNLADSEIVSRPRMEKGGFGSVVVEFDVRTKLSKNALKKSLKDVLAESCPALPDSDIKISKQ